MKRRRMLFEPPDYRTEPTVDDPAQMGLLGDVRRAPEASESDIQSRIINLLTRAGWLVVRVNGGGSTRGARYTASYHIPALGRYGAEGSRGHPDLVAYRSGATPTCRALFLEVKRPGEKPNEAQGRFIALADGMRIPVHVVASVEEVVRLLEETV